MLTLQLREGAFIPGYSTHFVGAGGVVINEPDELLVVCENYLVSTNRPPFFKLPGGLSASGRTPGDGGHARSARGDRDRDRVRTRRLLSPLARLPAR